MAVTPGRATISGAAAGHCLAGEFAGVQGPMSMCRRVAVKMLLSSQCVVQIGRAHLPTQWRRPYQLPNLPIPEFTDPRRLRTALLFPSICVTMAVRVLTEGCHVTYLI